MSLSFRGSMSVLLHCVQNGELLAVARLGEVRVRGGAVSLFDGFDETFLFFGALAGSAQPGPHLLHGLADVLGHVPVAAGAATEVRAEERPDGRPADAERIRDHLV